MTDRPFPTWVYHITRIEHLPSMIAEGVWSDTEASARGLTKVSIGYSHIKVRRARRLVDTGARGTLADYVPFYFAPRSPMLFAISQGKVGQNVTDCTRIAYLVTSVQHLRSRSHIVVTSDRHAVTPFARFTTDDDVLTESVDWALMQARYWRDTAEDPDRSDRRQAELLVHQRLSWDNILGVATANERTMGEVSALIGTHGATTRVATRPEWYF